MKQILLLATLDQLNPHLGADLQSELDMMCSYYSWLARTLLEEVNEVTVVASLRAAVLRF